MIKNKKLFGVLAILSLYIFGLILSFTGEFIQHFQNSRQQSQIKKISLSKNLEFSLKDWVKFNDAKEIQFQSDFYDVISIKKTTHKIIAKVVKDDFENEMRVAFSQIFNKHKLPLSEKKKTNSIAKHLNVNFKAYFNSTITLYIEKKSNFDFNKNLKIISFIDLPIKPPC